MGHRVGLGSAKSGGAAGAQALGRRAGRGADIGRRGQTGRPLGSEVAAGAQALGRRGERGAGIGSEGRTGRWHWVGGAARAPALGRRGPRLLHTDDASKVVEEGHGDDGGGVVRHLADDLVDGRVVLRAWGPEAP
eukprot:128867-Prymnesium_polylepis.1